MTLAILLSLKAIELPQIGVATHFQVRTVLLASLQSSRSVDTDDGSKGALRLLTKTDWQYIPDRQGLDSINLQNLFT